MNLNVLWCFLFFDIITPAYLYEYASRTFNVAIDHFAFTTSQTFGIRYLINDSWWDPSLSTSPIFFYAGNEGDVTTFAENTGLMWELAPEFRALVVFAEHRYYGESMPFGNLSLTDPKFSGYLSTSQAIADFIDLIQYLKTVYPKRANEQIPVIAFGGSYGGMLAAWMRMKYPGVVTGSLASSAPIWQFTGLTPCDTFNKIATMGFESSGSKKCADTIKKSWSAIDQVTRTDEGRRWLGQTFRTCSQISTKKDVKTFKNWLVGIYSLVAMLNYPYPTNFIAPLPGYPIKAICEEMDVPITDEPRFLLEVISKGVLVYTNTTGTTLCSTVEDDIGTTDAWQFQGCTELVIPSCDEGNTMFEEQPWDIYDVSRTCYKQFKVRPVLGYVQNLYGMKSISFASNIIFSNGLLDPWFGGGVLKNVSDTAIAVLLPDSAHHLDLRASNPADPPSVTAARIMYKQIFENWVKEIL